MLYQVKDWNTHYENSKSRERDECSFVCVPNKQHGLGFSRIMAEPDGAMIYGIFNLILGACSRQKRPREGWLTQNGQQAGTPWAPDDMALQFRRPQSEIDRSLEVLSSPKVAWLNAFDDAPMSGARRLPADCPPDTLEEKGREGKEEKRTEEKGRARAHEDEAAIPTAKEIQDYCSVGIGIPADYCEQYHSKKTVANGWIKNGQLIQWRIEIARWWASDRATWKQKGNKHSAATEGTTLRGKGVTIE